jgi:hypothetical protein
MTKCRETARSEHNSQSGGNQESNFSSGGTERKQTPSSEVWRRRYLDDPGGGLGDTQPRGPQHPRRSQGLQQQQQQQGPPGPLGVVTPQASPPVVLGGPTGGPRTGPEFIGSGADAVRLQFGPVQERTTRSYHEEIREVSRYMEDEHLKYDGRSLQEVRGALGDSWVPDQGPGVQDVDPSQGVGPGSRSPQIDTSFCSKLPPLLGLARDAIWSQEDGGQSNEGLGSDMSFPFGLALMLVSIVL